MPHPSLIDDLHWRYATKVFDAGKTIPADTWKTLEESLVLTPSSYGLQPWTFLIVTDPKTKAALRPHAWNQAQVTDCSHFVVFASKTTVSPEFVDKNFARTSEVRGVPAVKLTAYRDMILADLVRGARSHVVAEWAARQAYIALGQFMLACALLRVDACPMEGFSPVEFDKILGLTERGLTAAVCCAAGYRAEADKYASLPKVRFKAENVVEYI
jgi:nitroreductase